MTSRPGYVAHGSKTCNTRIHDQMRDSDYISPSDIPNKCNKKRRGGADDVYTTDIPTYSVLL